MLEKIPFKYHLFISMIIRIALIIYGEIHDINSELPYTDIDYKVVTDGARYILDNSSPFHRHTYRYSPLMAILLIPNILWHKSFGKFIFALFDLLVGYLIERIVFNELKCIFLETAEALLYRHRQRTNDNSGGGDINDSINYSKHFYLPEKYKKWAQYSALIWLYNPLTMVIATRGNGDSISCYFVLATLYFLHKYNFTNLDVFLAGICHGIAIHLRIYPLIFSLAYYLVLSNSTQILRKIFIPNQQQILLISGTIFSLFSLTGGFFYLYKWEYIYEAYLYHLGRQDIRHNFSLYFLMQYLGSNRSISILNKILINLPQFIIFVYLSLMFGNNRKTLSFCIFTQTFCMVTYNTVVTSQYFVWYLALLPLCLKNLRTIQTRLAISYLTLWIFGQILWLLLAYLLEFRTLNTFNLIGFQSVGFFFINIFILQRFIRYFEVISKIK